VPGDARAAVDSAGTAFRGRSSLKPAAAKPPSKASASVIRFLRISAKLVASTNEYGRSSWTRSHAHASVSSSSSTVAT